MTLNISCSYASSPSTSNIYAIQSGYFDSSTGATISLSCIEVTNYLKSINIFNDYTSTDPIDADSTAYSVHWVVLRDYIMPDANAYVDNELKSSYYTPLSKVENSGTRFQRQIIKIAALYCAWRLETRDYPGGGMPSDSPYAQSLKSMLDNELNNITSGVIRLKGQRLKSSNSRFCNPHVEPYRQSSTTVAPQPTIPPSTTAG